MPETSIPFELISNLISVAILVALFFKYYQYKKKLDVLKGLNELKQKKKLTSDDKEFIKTNIKDYRKILQADEDKIKFAYPLFILIAGILVAFLPFGEALIHLNIVVVAYIYLHVSRIHSRNFVKFLQELNQDID